MAKTAWRKAIQHALHEHGETFQDIIHTTLSDAEWDIEFYDGYGGAEGESFTAWTANRVYFPVVYDGAEWVASVPRNPCGEATEHVGGL